MGGRAGISLRSWLCSLTLIPFMLATIVTLQSCGNGNQEITKPGIAGSAPSESQNLRGITSLRSELTNPAGDTGYEVVYSFEGAAIPFVIGSSSQAPDYPVEFNIFVHSLGIGGNIRRSLREAGDSTELDSRLNPVTVSYPAINIISPVANATLGGSVTLAASLGDTADLPTGQRLPEFRVNYIYTPGNLPLGESSDQAGSFNLVFDPFAGFYDSPGGISAELRALDGNGVPLTATAVSTDSVPLAAISYSGIEFAEPLPGSLVAGPTDVRPLLIDSPSGLQPERVIYRLFASENDTAPLRTLAEVDNTPFDFSWDSWLTDYPDNVWLEAELHLQDIPGAAARRRIPLHIDHSNLLAFSYPQPQQHLAGIQVLDVVAGGWLADKLDRVEYWVAEAGNPGNSIKIGESRLSPFSLLWNTNDGRPYLRDSIMTARSFAAGGSAPLAECSLPLQIYRDPVGNILISSPAPAATISGSVNIAVSVDTPDLFEHVRYLVRSIHDNSQYLVLEDHGGESFQWDIGDYNYPDSELYLQAELYVANWPVYVAIDQVRVNIAGS